nr:unnamed protein product [Digitaria exilis]
MGIKNSTTTLAESWGTTQGRLVRVEVLVLFSAFIWILVEFFGSLRRQYNHGFFRFFVWAAYTLFTVLGPYTIGLLQDGPFRDQTFVLWGTILLVIQVSADSISVYSIHDIEQRKRVLVQHVLQIILVLWMILNCKGHNKSYAATIWIFWIHSIVLTYRKSRSLSNASKKEGLLKSAKVVADYMMIEHEQIPRDFNPKTMEGYKYIFHGEDEVASQLPTGPEYRVEFKEVTKTIRTFITIDSVWRWIESQINFTKEAMEIRKDVALSFSLFKLLKRRLCGYHIGEAGLTKTLHFVLNGLLSEEGQGQKAGKKIMLTDELIVRVLSGFKEHNGQLQDGHSALARNQLGSQFSWACTLPTHTHKILVWHIGTTIAMEGHPVPPTGDHRVAKTLSDYCAYLVAFVPDMLPGHGYDNQRIFDAVVMEARERLTRCDTVSSRCEMLVTMDLPRDSSCRILELGSRLGRELRGVVPEARRWKLLADFWAEFILFLAPSSNAEIHAEKLAAGGEFMTHLWALLTHAGILDRPSTTNSAGEEELSANGARPAGCRPWTATQAHPAAQVSCDAAAAIPTRPRISPLAHAHNAAVAPSQACSPQGRVSVRPRSIGGKWSGMASKHQAARHASSPIPPHWHIYSRVETDFVITNSHLIALE